MERSAIRQLLMKQFNIGLAGFMAGLVMFLCIYLGIYVTGWAPFNVSPSSAFLYNLGIKTRGWGLLLHFSYAILWSYVLVYTFEEDVSIRHSLIFSGILWIFMMLVYSPLIGWGIFGWGYAHFLAPDHPLYLANSYSYPVMTLLFHLVYGFTLGYLNNRWVRHNVGN